MQESSGWWSVIAGVAGMVAVLAVRHLLADVFSGLTLRAAPPFAVGDFVTFRLRDGTEPLVGLVQRIDSSGTELITPQGHPLRVPHRVTCAAAIERRRLPLPATEHALEIVLDGKVSPHRLQAVLDAAAMQTWSEGHTAGDEPATCHLDRLDGPGVVYRLVYRVDPKRHPEAVVREALIARVHLHLRHAGLQPLGAKPSEGTSTAQQPVDHARPEDRASCLARMRLFDALPADERQRLADQLIVRHELAGMPVVSQGAPGAAMYLVAAGALEVRVGASHAAPAQRIATLGPGDFFGEMSMLTGAPRSATVSTLSPGVLYEIPPRVLSALLRRQPALANGLSRVMSDHLRRDADRAGLTP